MKNLNRINVPRSFWTAKNFVAGFRNLRLPITTATEGQISGWDPKEVWAPFWESIRDYCDLNPASQELISAVVANAAQPGLSTRAHRALFEQWVSRHVPGYRIVWECDLVRELNEALAPLGEHVTAFEYGKDGRGALPDRYYHLLAERKCLVVGNHHDILGHFLLFSDPEIRRITEKIVRVSADGHSLHEAALAYRQRHYANNPQLRERFERAVLHPMRPVMALMTFSWNLAQEKIYFSKTENGRSYFSLLGAFNTVYNTTLSSRLDIKHADSTVSGLGVLANQGIRNIVMLPGDMRRWLHRPEAPSDSVVASIEAYADALEAIGWKRDPDQLEATEHAARFRSHVMKNLFAQWGPIRLPVGMRWRRFGKALQADPLFSKLLTREAMLRLAEAQIDVAEAAIRHHTQFFTERGQVSIPRFSAGADQSAAS